MRHLSSEVYPDTFWKLPFLTRSRTHGRRPSADETAAKLSSPAARGSQAVLTQCDDVPTILQHHLRVEPSQGARRFHSSYPKLKFYVLESHQVPGTATLPLWPGDPTTTPQRIRTSGNLRRGGWSGLRRGGRETRRVPGHRQPGHRDTRGGCRPCRELSSGAGDTTPRGKEDRKVKGTLSTLLWARSTDSRGAAGLRPARRLKATRSRP